MKKLTDVGDPVAMKVFKDEIIHRLETGAINVFWYLLEQNYFNYLTNSEIEVILSDSSIRKKILTSKDGLKDIHKRYNLEYQVIPRLVALKNNKAATLLFKEIILEAGNTDTVN